MSDETKLHRLAHALWRDAEEEAATLRALLAEAHDSVCSLTCRSHFPPGHVHSEADHSEQCRAISAALNNPASVQQDEESKA